ncbi:MAG: FAD-dependent oxidoreductase [Thermodesulfobacteriota bacterium]|jgi:succinate dehydrogenase/fumarate reductase flavoprotein subunit
MKADIVIIGAGGAGLPSALTAYEKGSHTLVLRKRGIVGGADAEKFLPKNA